jgi:hypothetical protein
MVSVYVYPVICFAAEQASFDGAAAYAAPEIIDMTRAKIKRTLVMIFIFLPDFFISYFP